MDSYSVRRVFLWARKPRGKSWNLYEERITLWRAESVDSALELAEAEARTYAADNGVELLEYSVAYALFDAIDASGVEVFSLLRESELEPSAYLDTFFDTGRERLRLGEAEIPE